MVHIWIDPLLVLARAKISKMGAIYWDQIGCLNRICANRPVDFADVTRAGFKTHEIGMLATALAQWCTSGFAQAGAWVGCPGYLIKVDTSPTF